MTNYLLSRGYRKWEKKDKEGNVTQCRIYINDLVPLMKEIGYENPKRFRTSQMYYNVLEDKFYFSTTSSREETIKKLIEYLRNKALDMSLHV